LEQGGLMNLRHLENGTYEKELFESKFFSKRKNVFLGGMQII